MAIFSTIERPERNIHLSYFSAMSISCCTREIHDEKAAIISLHFVHSDTIFSRASPTSFSLIENHFVVEPVESERSIVIPLFPIASYRSKLAGLSRRGVWSILKSQV